MGSTVSPETMGNYVSRNIENAYENSNTERDFINYFKREAEEQGIDLTNEDNENTLDEILKPYIKIFLKRKKEKKTIEEQSQYIRRLKLQLENEHENYLKSQRENSRLIETLKDENENAEIEIKKREENFKEKLYKNQKIAEERIREIEEDTRKYIQRLKEDHEKENRRRDENQREIIKEIYLKQQQREKEYSERLENNMKVINELKKQLQEENRRRDNN